MENQVSAWDVHLRHYLLEDISLFHAAVSMRLRSRSSHSNWHIGYVAAKVFKERASEAIEALGGMAGEW